MFTVSQTVTPTRLARAALFACALALAWPAIPAAAQAPGAAVRPEFAPLKAKAEQRFQVLVTRQSLVLVPKTPIKGVTNIELSDGLVLVDGNAVTGKELRTLLGADTEVVVQLSFIDAAARRQIFEPARTGQAGAEPAAPAHVGVPEPAAPPSRPESTEPSVVVTDEWSGRSHSRGGGARVRVGGDVRVGAEERFSNDVVAILGSALIDGAVDGDVVAVLGNVKLGPKGIVTGSVTSVGGEITRAEGSRISGEVNEVRVTAPNIRPFAHFVAPWRGWTLFSNPFSATVELVGTLVRVGIIGLLAVMLVALMPAKVQGVSDRIVAEPWRAAFTGLAAQLLFVPAIVLVSTVLLVSIVGIPLLLLMPFVVLALVVACLVGFTGVGYAIGERFGHRADRSLTSLIVPLVTGLAVIWAFTLVARFVGLAGGSVRYIVSGVLLVGFVIEYVAWTVGLGGVLLSRFGRRQTVPPTSFDPPPLEREPSEMPGAPPPGL